MHDAYHLQSIVDAVNDIIRRWGLGSEAGFVLLDDLLLGTGKAWDAVHVAHRLVRSIRSNLSSNSRVHARHLQVNTHVGVVNINNFVSPKVLDVVVVANGIGSGGKSSDTGSSAECGEELTTLGGKLSAELSRLWGNKGRGDAVLGWEEEMSW